MPVSDHRTLSLAREPLIEWYLRNRERSRRIFDLIDSEVYYTRPIALRNPIVFYEGHLPAFSVIAFLKRGLGQPAVDERLEQLFARGIDPDSPDAAVPRSGASTAWPERKEVLAFGRAADEAVLAALRDAPFVEDRPAMQHGEAVFTALEHEAMHQETLLYMWHRLPHEHKHRPSDLAYELGGRPPSPASVMIPAGTATLGADRGSIPFGWDNEFGRLRADVPAFEIDVYNVTNADYLAFVEDNGYQRPELWSEADWAWRQEERLEYPIFWVRRGDAWYWHGMFEDLPLPAAWPVYVSQAEANAYARWRRRRLPTEGEFQRAAFGAPEGVDRPFPWGAATPDGTRGNFDFTSWEPVPVGARPAGASAWGVHDLIGNGWEWTSTVFGPLPGFSPMASYPEYSADFFDGQHYVIKGASQATARELVRASFRNWFRPNYPYVYADLPHGRGGAALMPVIDRSFAATFAAEVGRDLALDPKQLQSKYLYDALGSSLFDAICRLPWYRITRAETSLLATHAEAIISTLGDASGTLVELGCGSGEKLVVLAEALQGRGGSAQVHLIDISQQALQQTEERLGRLQHFPVVAHQATYDAGLRNAVAQRQGDGPMLVLFLGSNLGNFDTPAAAAFLNRVRRALAPGDLLLLGADLIKEEQALLLAYDDPLGVTAAFNRNLLVRINRELEADFELSGFAHRAVWNASHQRIEMHLVSLADQQVRIGAAGVTVSFRRGEWIWTESSYKYSAEQIVDMGAAANFAAGEQWIDDDAGFALTLFTAI